MTPALELIDLVRTYPSVAGPVQALAGVSMRVHTGEVVAVVGPSGSGKSTLLGLLAGLDRPDGGQVLVAGRDLATMSDNEASALRARSIGIVFQSFRLLATLSAVENVRLPMELAGRRDAAERAGRWLDRVGLSARAGHLPTMLSGGEQQRVAIARALAGDPALVLADEPTGNLDSATGDHIADLLLELARADRTTLVIVTHDQALAARADHRVHLRDGRVERTS